MELPKSQKGFAHIVLPLIVVLTIAFIGGLYLYFKPTLNSKSSLSTTFEKSFANVTEEMLVETPSYDANTSDVLNLVNYRNLINDGEIFFIKNGKIYKLDTYSMESSEFIISGVENPSDLSFSGNGQYLFMTSGERIVINYMNNQKTVRVEEDIGPSPRVLSSHISPNNEYFIVTTSCCPGDVGRTVVDIDGEILKTLTGGTAVWSPGGSKFALSKGEFELSVLPLGPTPRNSSIYLEELKGEKLSDKLLVKATGQVSFRPVEWLDDKTLIYKKVTYSKPFPENPSLEEMNNEESWEEWFKIYENPKVSYWKLKIDENKEEQLDSYEERENLASYSPTKKWKIVTEVEDSKFVRYISSSDGGTKIKLEVDGAIWKPTQ